MDELFKKSNPLSIDKTMTTMHKAMEGVLFYHDVQKLHTVGNMCECTLINTANCNSTLKECSTCVSAD